MDGLQGDEYLHGGWLLSGMQSLLRSVNSSFGTGITGLDRRSVRESWFLSRIRRLRNRMLEDLGHENLEREREREREREKSAQ